MRGDKPALATHVVDANIFECLHAILRVHQLAVTQQRLQDTCLPCSCCVMYGGPPLQFVDKERLCSAVQQEIHAGDMPAAS